MIGSLGHVVRRVWRNPSARFGLAALGAILVAAVIGPWFLPDPAAMPDISAGARPPGWMNWLGTDRYSRDILARVLGGARISLAIGGLAVALSITIGAGVGLVAGWAGGWIDTVVMRLVDAALAIPRLFVLLLLIVIWDRIGVPALIVVLGATGWLGTSRIVRGEVLRLRHAGFIEAAEALGASTGRIFWRHLLPNVTGPLLVAATLGVGDVILLEAGLSFLGLGIQPPTPSWGGMILQGRSTLFTAPWESLFPGLLIVLTVLAINLVGDALRSALDPRSA